MRLSKEQLEEIRKQAHGDWSFDGRLVLALLDRIEELESAARHAAVSLAFHCSAVGADDELAAHAKRILEQATTEKS